MKAAIFDMDGLLLDSEKICLDTFLQACKKVCFVADIEVYLQAIGCNQERSKQLLVAGYGPDFPYDEIKALWSELYFASAYDIPVPLMTGAVALLTRLSNAGIPMAVATSTAHQQALKKLANANILSYFDIVIGGDQVSNSKPAPDIYLKACAELQQDAVDCMAFEDSVNGVRAALNAGLTVIQVPDLILPNAEVLSWGHQIVDSLLDVDFSLEGEHLL